MRREDIIARLLSMDEEANLLLGQRIPKPRIVVVGGAAFLLLDSTDRTVTYDVDVYEADEALREILAQYPEFNGSVAAYADHIPFNYEDRLTTLDIGAKAIDFVVPSAEDLAVMKLYADRPSDRIDVESAVRRGAISLDKLDQLVYGEDEAAASALNERRYREMIWAYERMKEALSDELDV